MVRPYIICHMATSLDGKIIGDYLEVGRAAYFTDVYEKIHETETGKFFLKRSRKTE